MQKSIFHYFLILVLLFPSLSVAMPTKPLPVTRFEDLTKAVYIDTEELNLNPAPAQEPLPMVYIPTRVEQPLPALFDAFDTPDDLDLIEIEASAVDSSDQIAVLPNDIVTIKGRDYLVDINQYDEFTLLDTNSGELYVNYPHPDAIEVDDDVFELSLASEGILISESSHGVY